LASFGRYTSDAINEIILQSYIVGMHYGCTLSLPRNVALSYIFSGDKSVFAMCDFMENLYDEASSRCRL